MEQARKILTALQWGPFIKSDNSQLIPLCQLELFRAKTVLEGKGYGCQGKGRQDRRDRA